MRLRGFKRWLASAPLLLLAGCVASVRPIDPLEQQRLLAEDRSRALAQLEPVQGTLTLADAMARGLKYNLDYRSQMMAKAIAEGTANLGQYDLLPKLMGTAGYNFRDSYFLTRTRGPDGQFSQSAPIVTSARESASTGLSMSWSLLDFGMSLYGARQNGDRVLAAMERQRRTAHLLLQDIQSAYLRAAAAAKLQSEVQATMQMARTVLANSLKVEEKGLKSPLDTLRFRKSLLENLKALGLIDEEFTSARIELNKLLNLPVTSLAPLEDPDLIALPQALQNTDANALELRALALNSELRESIYNTRVALDETHKSLLKMIPGLVLNYGIQNSNNSNYVNQNWTEGAMQVSFNLLNLIMLPQTQQLARDNAALAELKRMALQMALISQVHLGRQQYLNAHMQLGLSIEADNVEQGIARIMGERLRAGAISEAEKVSADTSMIVVRLRRYQALSQLFSASGRLRASLGIDAVAGNPRDMSLSDLSQHIQKALTAWNAGQLPEVMIERSQQAAGGDGKGGNPSVSETKSANLSQLERMKQAVTAWTSDAWSGVAGEQLRASLGALKRWLAVEDDGSVEPSAAEGAAASSLTRPATSRLPLKAPRSLDDVLGELLADPAAVPGQFGPRLSPLGTDEVQP